MYLNSTSHELHRLLDSGYLPVGVGVGLMVTFVSTTIGGVHRVDGMVLVGLAAIGTIFLSVSAGFGLASAMGIKLNSLSPIIPLLMLGIGVDDAFVLINTYVGFANEDTVSDKVTETLREAGLAILMTSLTDVAAFAAGSLTEVNAVRQFCGLAACCVVTDFLLQITLFIAVLVFDRTRASKNRLWAACWITSTAEPAPMTERQRRNTLKFNPLVHKLLVEEASPNVHRFLVKPVCPLHPALEPLP